MQNCPSTPVGSIIDETMGEMKDGESLEQQCARVQEALRTFFRNPEGIITAVKVTPDNNSLFNNANLGSDEIEEIIVTPEGLFIPLCDGINFSINAGYRLAIEIGENSMCIHYDAPENETDWLNWNFIVAVSINEEDIIVLSIDEGDSENE